jgi:hypothetical protein
LPVTVRPGEVSQGLFYDGGRLEVRGSAPDDGALVVLLEGERRHETHVKKGLRGSLWLPEKGVAVAAAPTLYLLASEGDLHHLLTGEERRREGLGLSALRTSLGTGPEGVADAEEILRVWRRSGRVFLADRGVERRDGAFFAGFDLPPRLEEGVLLVKVFLCREGRVAEKSVTEVPVRRTGLAAFLSRAAREHPAAYGAGAAFLALLLGGAVGTAFPRLKGH